MQIYAIRNKITNKYYVGQTKTDIVTRYKNLKKWGHRNKNSEIHKDIKNYGYDSFEFILLEKNISSKELLNKKEIKWAKKLNSYFPNGYNLVHCGNIAGFCSDITRSRMSKAKKGIVPWSKGKKASLATRKKQSLAKLGCTPWNKGKKMPYPVWNKGIPLKEETKKKLSKALKGRRVWNKGKKLSKKHVASLRLAQQKRWNNYKNNLGD